MHYRFECQRLAVSHDELRPALIVAGKRIRHLNFGRRDDPVLKVLRAVLKDARGVRAEFKAAEARPLHTRVNLSEDRYAFSGHDSILGNCLERRVTGLMLVA